MLKLSTMVWKHRGGGVEEIYLHAPWC